MHCDSSNCNRGIELKARYTDLKVNTCDSQTETCVTQYTDNFCSHRDKQTLTGHTRSCDITQVTAIFSCTHPATSFISYIHMMPSLAQHKALSVEINGKFACSIKRILMLPCIIGQIL